MLKSPAQSAERGMTARLDLDRGNNEAELAARVLRPACKPPSLEWLEKGVEERDVTLVGGLKSAASYIALHGPARSQALLREMHLET